jgi:hypothetical protein
LLKCYVKYRAVRWRNGYLIIKIVVNLCQYSWKLCAALSGIEYVTLSLRRIPDLLDADRLLSKIYSRGISCAVPNANTTPKKTGMRNGGRRASDGATFQEAVDSQHDVPIVCVQGDQECGRGHEFVEESASSSSGSSSPATPGNKKRPESCASVHQSKRQSLLPGGNTSGGKTNFRFHLKHSSLLYWLIAI